MKQINIINKHGKCQQKESKKSAHIDFDRFLFLIFCFIINEKSKNKKEWGQFLMERYAWKAAVRDGMIDEYRRRHAEIWPEMVQVLKEAGIGNYTIWNSGNELFGYYECEKGMEYAAKVQAESPVVARWNDYMQDVLLMEMDPETGAQPLLRQVFLLE